MEEMPKETPAEAPQETPENRPESPFLEGAQSPDGYIVDQSRCTNIRYGCRNADYNGCGWIAAYNFLKAAGETPTVPELTKKLLRGSLLRGLVGTRCITLYAFLKRRGYPLKAVFGAKRVVSEAAGAREGILFYRHKDGWHYVCYIPAEAEEGKLRFLNAWTGPVDPVRSMEAFLATCVRSKFLIAMFV